MKKRLSTDYFRSKLGVSLHLHPHPAIAHALAVAEGDHVFLNLRDDFLGSARSLRMLRHELCHVLQQRQGRVTCIGLESFPVNCDPALELEAEIAAEAEVSDKLFLELMATRGTQPGVWVLQCLTRIADKKIADPQDLSVKARDILSLIPSGDLWTRRIGAARQSYAFGTEAEFLLAVQQRLHSSQVLVLPRLELTVSPRALCDMHLDEVKQILEIEKQRGDQELERKSEQA
ncbi:DUF4157 domain-containing protein [Silvibacterium sp.]|uniref:eCIS core domain-containing protein n=1 Tax=Silvibacterium sp. TaxID=1964179 RepID=UPI0039E4EF2B